MTFLITLNNCSNKEVTPTVDDRVIIKYVDINKTVPSELLEVVAPPSLSLLKDVEICGGKESALKYLKELYDAWFIGNQQIIAIKKHLVGANDAK